MVDNRSVTGLAARHHHTIGNACPHPRSTPFHVSECVVLCVIVNSCEYQSTHSFLGVGSRAALNIVFVFVEYCLTFYHP